MHRNWTADEDGQLLEMLRIDCHRAIIAKSARPNRDGIERVGVLKALRASGGNFRAAETLRARQADEMPLLR